MSPALNHSDPLVVTRIGREGDGVAECPGGPAFIPNGLPGEAYVANADGTYALASNTSSLRVAPPCRHFGVCGGCVAQHLDAETYSAWKQDLIRSSFGAHALAPTLLPIVTVPAHSRRRAAMTAIVHGAKVRLGFRERRSRALVNLAECPVLAPAIVAALPAMRAIARILALGARREIELRLEIAALAGGLDVAITGVGKPPPAQVSADIAALARGFIARLSVEGQTVCSEGEPALETSGGAIVPPPGAFFQAVAAAEQRMTASVLEGIGKAKAVADLFCGVGTFTLPLAQRARVVAVDSDKSALQALSRASRAAKGLRPIETKLRNLMSEPLSPLELSGLDAVVLDPPRAGAKSQCEAVAKSKIATVVMVSCNPVTMARDCRILVDAGFSPGPVQGIDQFLWSPHVEAVVVLARRPK